MDPIVPSLLMGIAGNLATNVVEAKSEHLADTRLGKALAKSGLLRPGLAQRLQDAVATAAANLLVQQTQYNLPEIHRFLKSKTLAVALYAYIIDIMPIELTPLAERLSHYVGVPLENAPSAWPNRIEPYGFIRALLHGIQVELGSNADNGTIWLSRQLAAGTHKVDIANEQLARITSKLDTFEVERIEERSKEKLEFERHYLEHLSSRFRKITTPGARELHGVTQSLSIAYISLNLKAGITSDAVRAEKFLSMNPSVLIRGAAGSGKTTLLSWIISQCTSTTEESRNENEWYGLIPFFVPLRKVARLDNGKPALNRLIDYSVDEKVWTKSTPSGWIDHVLRSRRAIIMIDGVDELPANKRPDFWVGLQEALNEYPGNRVIVTSRALPGSAAIGTTTDQWNPPATMVESQLQDMSNSDVTQFIHHWHDAVDTSKLDQVERSGLEDARIKLPVKLEDPANRRIRELCNTPLLCAMVCVLHWREEGYLPRYRVDLYDKCCEMLIEARDLKREITPPAGSLSAMSKNDKEMVLQRLAIEMMHNRHDGDDALDDSYRIEISREKALKWIQPKIASFQNPSARDAKPYEVLDFLIERTGLLREPATDLIDFPHRTFQEYLAACAAGADSQEEMLARKADDDQWHETIMLAAGTTTGGVAFGRSLIEALIARGERHKSPRKKQQGIRKTCFALALGCLENLKQHEPSLRERVLSNLGELVPPRSDTDAGILAVAGDAAVPHLTYSDFKDENTATVAACARALRLIGTTEAMKAIESGYIADQREPVLVEICKTEQFSYEKIPFLVQHVDEYGFLPHFAGQENLSLLVNLPGIKAVNISWKEGKHLNKLCELNDLQRLTLNGVFSDTVDLSNLPKAIEHVTLAKYKSDSIDWLANLENLSIFEITSDNARLNFGVLSSLLKLENLYMRRISQESVATIGPMHQLKSLTLFDVDSDTGFSFLSGMENLRQLSVGYPSSDIDIDMLTFLSSLEEVSLYGCNHLKNQRSFSKLEKLKLLDIGNNKGILDLSEILNLPNIEKLKIDECRSIHSSRSLEKVNSLRSLQISDSELDEAVNFGDIPLLETLIIHAVPELDESWLDGISPTLRELVIGMCPRLRSLRELRKCDQLRALALSSLPNLEQADFLTSLRHLETLQLQSCESVSSLDAIAHLPVSELTLISMRGLSSVDAIRTLERLRIITIIECDLIKDLSFLDSLPSLEKIVVSPPIDGLHIPENLMPKVEKAEYYHRFRAYHTDWLSNHWLYEEYDGRIRRVPGPFISRLF